MTGCKRGETLNSLPFLPFDLVAEILCRLPVKHLLQLCCVCKSWNSFISHDSVFAKKHLRFSTTNHHRHHLVLSSMSSSRELLLSDSAISSIFTSPSTTSFTHLSHPIILLNLNNGYYGARVSTCHGMLCIGIDQSYAILCNPSIRKFKMLPPLLNPNPDRKYLRTIFTLVYDRFTNNYKIIALPSDNNNHNKKQVYVHTLGTDYWRRIQDLPYDCSILLPGIFVSDTVNWLAYDSFATIIVSLDLEKELCQELSHPFYDNQSETSITLGVLRDCLCILSNSHKFSDVWIMKEYGNGQSWTKLLRVPLMGDPCFYACTRALYISEDDQVLMLFLKMGKFSLVVYDSRNDTFKIPEFQNKIHDPVVYVESLISPFSQY